MLSYLLIIIFLYAWHVFLIGSAADECKMHCI